MSEREEFEGNNKYTVILRLGDGAFGIVYKVSNKCDEKLALKHIFKYGCNPAGDEAGTSTTQDQACTSSTVDHRGDSGEPPRKKRKKYPPGKKNCVVRSLREYKMLRRLQRNPNVTGLIDAYDHKQNGRVFPHLVFDLCDCDLTRLWNLDITISKEQHRWLTFQILSGVQHIHRQNVIHRDLKSQNVLVRLTNTVQLKLADFGSATSFAGMTSWITEPPTFSKLYQPPEVHLGAKRYRVNADLWCAGLIIAEIQWKKPVIDQDNYDASLGEVCGRIANQCEKDFEINKRKLVTHNNYAKRRNLMDEILKKINDKSCIGEILEETLCSPHRRSTADALIRERGKRLSKGKCQVLEELATELKLSLLDSD